MSERVKLALLSPMCEGSRVSRWLELGEQHGVK